MTDHLLGSAPPRLAALHGFTQRGQMFEELAAVLDVGVWAPDLPGHGSARTASDWDGVVADVAAALEPVGPTVLLGYSQGGRVALGVASRRPELVTHLVLVSTSPGIPDAGERAVRKARDTKLADHIERVGTDRFVAEWVSLTMFNGVQGLDDEWKERDLALRRSNAADGLAAALRAYGTGAMPYLGETLAGLDCGVTVVVGGDDEAYRTRAFEMAETAGGSLHVVGGAGHAIVAEAPYALADIVRNLI